MTRQDGEIKPRIEVLPHDHPVTIQATEELVAAIKALPADQRQVYGGISPQVAELRRQYRQTGANPGALDRVLGEIRTEQADEVNPIR